jgi:hypothetical protein
LQVPDRQVVVYDVGAAFVTIGGDPIEIRASRLSLQPAHNGLGKLPGDAVPPKSQVRTLPSFSGMNLGGSSKAIGFGSGREKQTFQGKN